MRTPLLAACITAMVGGAASNALAQSTIRKNAGPGYDELVSADGHVARSDNTGKGAVMCLLGIYVAAQLAGDECAKGRDVDFKQELGQSVAQVDQFIIRNSSKPVSQADLERRSAAAATQLRKQGPICEGGAHAMYEGLRARGTSALRAGTADALSIPREPVMNPCL